VNTFAIEFDCVRRTEASFYDLFSSTRNSRHEIRALFFAVRLAGFVHTVSRAFNSWNVLIIKQ